jgi:outer membrane protein assembly factor BamE (lipoprotein component of BamABCDE complex)
MSVKIKTFFLVLIVISSLNSCFKKVAIHGYPEDETLVTKLKIGSTTKEEAITLLGEPSTKSTFNQDIWYYISIKMEAVGFLKADIVQEQVMQLNFQNDKLQEIIFSDSSTKKKIVFNKEKSLVEGDDTGVLKDFFHNFGRFNKALKR